jgi:hypothetical protein
MSAEHLNEEEQLQLESALFGFPESIEVAYLMYVLCDSWSKRLDTRSKGLKKYLRDQIPVETNEEGRGEAVVEGVRRKVWYQESTAYSKALEEVKKVVVPKTRWEQVDEIVAKHTSNPTLRDKLSEATD